MWQPQGKTADPNPLGTLAPDEVLFEFDCEPITYVSTEPDGGLLLVHSLIADQGTSRYLVVPIDARILTELKAGRLDLFSGLRQPRCWVVDLVAADENDPPYQVQAVVRVAFDSIPLSHLPKPGVMVRPELDPIFRLRLVGPGVGPGKTTAADVRMATKAAESGLRALARIALDEEKKVGRARRSVRDFSDLPFQYSRAASFEVAFGRPGEQTSEGDQKVFDEMGRLLSEVLKSLRSDADGATLIAGLDAKKSAQLLEAVRAMTPPLTGDVERIEIGGNLVGPSSVSVSLTRDDRSRSNRRIKAWHRPAEDDGFVGASGVVEEADQGRLVFTLRQVELFRTIDKFTQEQVKVPQEVVFNFEEQFLDDVMEFFNSQERVRVWGETFKSGYDVLSIRPLSDLP